MCQDTGSSALQQLQMLCNRSLSSKAVLCPCMNVWTPDANPDAPLDILHSAHGAASIGFRSQNANSSASSGNDQPAHAPRPPSTPRNHRAVSRPSVGNAQRAAAHAPQLHRPPPHAHAVSQPSVGNDRSVHVPQPHMPPHARDVRRASSASNDRAAHVPHAHPMPPHFPTPRTPRRATNPARAVLNENRRRRRSSMDGGQQQPAAYRQYLERNVRQRMQAISQAQLESTYSVFVPAEAWSAWLRDFLQQARSMRQAEPHMDDHAATQLLRRRLRGQSQISGNPNGTINSDPARHARFQRACRQLQLSRQIRAYLARLAAARAQAAQQQAGNNSDRDREQQRR